MNFRFRQVIQQNMKISIWVKYQFTKFILLIINLILFIICSYLGYDIIGIGIGIMGPFIITLILHTIKCPKCGTPIDNSESILGGLKNGFFTPMGKKCKNCGMDFTSITKGK